MAELGLGATLEGGDPRARVVELETWNAALAEEVEKATTRADLRAQINRMEARERRRHPVIRKIAQIERAGVLTGVRRGYRFSS